MLIAAVNYYKKDQWIPISNCFRNKDPAECAAKWTAINFGISTADDASTHDVKVFDEASDSDDAEDATPSVMIGTASVNSLINNDSSMAKTEVATECQGDGGVFYYFYSVKQRYLCVCLVARGLPKRPRPSCCPKICKTQKIFHSIS